MLKFIVKLFDIMYKPVSVILNVVNKGRFKTAKIVSFKQTLKNASYFAGID